MPAPKSVEVRNELRSLYEAGQYDNVYDFWEKMAKNLNERQPDKYPKYKAILKWAKSDRWGSHSVTMSKTYSTITVAMYAKYGLTPDKAAELVADGAIGPERAFERLRDAVKNACLPNEILDSDRLVIIMNLVRDYITEFRNSKSYIEEYHKVVGAYAPVKKAVQTTGMKVNVRVNPQDVPAVIQKMKARLARYECIGRQRSD